MDVIVRADSRIARSHDYPSLGNPLSDDVSWVLATKHSSHTTGAAMSIFGIGEDGVPCCIYGVMYWIMVVM